MLGREGRVIVPGVGGLVSAGQADERGLDGVGVAAGDERLAQQQIQPRPERFLPVGEGEKAGAAGHAGVERLAAVPQDKGAQRLGQRAPAVAAPVVQPHGIVFEIAGQREFTVGGHIRHAVKRKRRAADRRFVMEEADGQRDGAVRLNEPRGQRLRQQRRQQKSGQQQAENASCAHVSLPPSFVSVFRAAAEPAAKSAAPAPPAPARRAAARSAPRPT